MKQRILGYAAGVLAFVLGFDCVKAGAFTGEGGSCVAALSGVSVRASSSGRASRDPRPNWYVTEQGYVAAIEEELLDRAIFWAGVGSEKEFEHFVDSSPLVFPLKGGIRVYIEGFSFSGKVKIRPEGSQVSVWTIREAIRSLVLQ